MARGWESKSVESQQVEGEGARGDWGKVPKSSEERERQRKRASLELSRRRVLQDLAAAGSPARRASLEQALAHLDEELRKLG